MRASASGAEGEGPLGAGSDDGDEAAFALELAWCAGAHRSSRPLLQVVRREDTRGRGLVARARIAKGKDVLVEEPFAAVLFSEEVSRFCDFSFKPHKKLLRCAKSKVARYASREAQAAAWKSYYREECKALVRIRPHLPSPMVRLAARVCWRRRTARNSQWAAVCRLENHWAKFSDRKKMLLAEMANRVRALLEGTNYGAASDAAADPAESASFTVKGICMTLARLLCNIHTITDDELKPIGLGVYPIGSLANHSCTPNCVQVYQGNKLVYRCIRDIAPGEEVLISYVDLCSLESERRDFLLKEYFFDIGAEAFEAEAGGEEVAAGVRLYGAGRWQGQGAAAAPKSLGNESERRLVSIEGRQGAGSQWEEVGRAFVLARKGPQGDGDRAGEEEEEAPDKSREQEQRQLTTFASSFSAGIGNILGDDVVAVCSFETALAVAETKARAAAAGGLLRNVHNFLAAAERLSKEGKFDEAMESLRATLDLCRNGTADAAGATFRLGESHISRIRARSLLLHVSLQLGKFDVALRVARALVPPYRMLYTERSPVFGLHMAIIAKLQNYFGADFINRSALAVAREALASLEATLPRGNPAIQEVEQIMNGFLAELSARSHQQEGSCVNP